jgi:hypothetical protein
MALLFLSFAMSLTSCNDEEEIDVPVLVDALDRGLIVRISKNSGRYA